MGVLAWAVIIGWTVAFGCVYWLMNSKGWMAYYLLMASLTGYYSVVSGSSVATGIVMGWMLLPFGVGAAGGVFG